MEDIVTWSNYISSSQANMTLGAVWKYVLYSVPEWKTANVSAIFKKDKNVRLITIGQLV